MVRSFIIFLPTLQAVVLLLIKLTHIFQVEAKEEEEVEYIYVKAACIMTR